MGSPSLAWPDSHRVAGSLRTLRAGTDSPRSVICNCRHSVYDVAPLTVKSSHHHKLLTRKWRQSILPAQDKAKFWETYTTLTMDDRWLQRKRLDPQWSHHNKPEEEVV